MESNYSGTTISTYVTTFKAIIKFMIAKNGVEIVEKSERTKFINSGEDIDSLASVKIIHGFCASARKKLVSVPEPIEVLQERNNWEEWSLFKSVITRGKIIINHLNPY